MMETITLIDGTVLDGTVMAGPNNLFIFVYLHGLSLAEGYTIFSNPENIARLAVMDHGEEFTYEGYTEITAINSEFGNCNLTMRKAENNAA